MKGDGDGDGGDAEELLACVFIISMDKNNKINGDVTKTTFVVVILYTRQQLMCGIIFITK